MINESLTVSVVVPTYNRAALITDALDSIKDQDFPPLEIIVVDDGSTDDTATVVENWRENAAVDIELRYVHQQNQGGNVARNRGINQAHANLVAFLDSDDVWHKTKLRRQIEILQKDPQIGAVYCGLQHVNIETKHRTAPAPRSYPQGWLFHQIIVSDVTNPTSTYLIRKEVFEKVGTFDVDLQARQDWDMWIRISQDYQIGCVPEILVDFRDHAGPRTATNPTKEINAYNQIMKKYARQRADCPFAVRQAAKSSYYRRLGRVHFHQNISSSKALGYYLAAIGTWPVVFDNYAALAGWFLPKLLRQKLHQQWNRVFGKSKLSIRSH